MVWGWCGRRRDRKTNHHFGSWSGKPPIVGTAQEIARDLDPKAWQRLSAGVGIKGARLHDWTYCELADLDVDEYNETESGLWTPGLLIRRNISDRDLAFFTTWVPGRDGHPDVRFRGRPSLGDRRQFRNRQERSRARSQRNPDMAWLASSRLPRHARLRHDGSDPLPCQSRDAPKRLRMPTIRVLYAGPSRKSDVSPIGLPSVVHSPPPSSHGHAGDARIRRPVPRRIGRTKGGLRSKLHAVCDDDGRPIIMLLSERQMSDHNGARIVLNALPKAASSPIRATTEPGSAKSSSPGESNPASRHQKAGRKPYVYDKASIVADTSTRPYSPNSRIGGASQHAMMCPHLLLSNLHRSFRHLLTVINEML